MRHAEIADTQNAHKEEVMQGTVKWFNAKRGYGFIVGENGKDIFIHFTDIQAEGFKTLNDGDIVEYELVNAEKGLKAVNIKKIKSGQVSKKPFVKKQFNKGI